MVSYLGLFVSRRGEAGETAFSALVERHGPMVPVCRSILRDEHDAQDAFQATFLVLFDRAGSVRERGPSRAGSMGSRTGRGLCPRLGCPSTGARVEGG